MIYDAQQIGLNDFLFDLEIPENNYILAVLYIPCNNDSTDINGNKQAILEVNNCNGCSEVTIEGVEEVSEDLLNGQIWFEDLGTWNTTLYYQDNKINTDPVNATFLDNIQLQIS